METRSPKNAQSGFTMTGNRNRSSIFAFIAFSDGKPASTPAFAGAGFFLKIL
jgi:hypothetical protein